MMNKFDKFDKLYDKIKKQLIMEQKKPMVTYTDPVNTYCGVDEEFQADVADLEQSIIDEFGLSGWTPAAFHEQMCMEDYPTNKRYSCPCAAAYDAWRKKDMKTVEQIMRRCAENYEATDGDIQYEQNESGFHGDHKGQFESKLQKWFPDENLDELLDLLSEPEAGGLPAEAYKKMDKMIEGGADDSDAFYEVYDGWDEEALKSYLADNI